ncbi:MAG TPA: class I SAM-dependent methyltransferase [Rhizomicrobium sp.]|jgi:SAM-dependent methyltransferase
MRNREPGAQSISLIVSKAHAIGRRAKFAFKRATRRQVVGQFQPYNHTLPDRYPWIFRHAVEALTECTTPRILSFGCSRGDEVFALADYFPRAEIRGLDIDPANIARCRERVASAQTERLSFAAAATTALEPSENYDALFCLAVLCNGDLTNSGAERCDPIITFQAFERMVGDFARCLKPGGFLFLHTANFRFCDTAVARHFEVVLKAEPSQLARDVLFDRNNCLMRGARYQDVGFRKSR